MVKTVIRFAKVSITNPVSTLQLDLTKNFPLKCFFNRKKYSFYKIKFKKNLKGKIYISATVFFNFPLGKIIIQHFISGQVNLNQIFPFSIGSIFSV